MTARTSPCSQALVWVLLQSPAWCILLSPQTGVFLSEALHWIHKDLRPGLPFAVFHSPTGEPGSFRNLCLPGLQSPAGHHATPFPPGGTSLFPRCLPSLGQISAPIISFPVFQEMAERIEAGVAKEGGLGEEGAICEQE